ncbi:MAG: SLC26A/SulP transporter family protein [Anaerolineales bacterium]|nr:SLC26A/SulP transporter family protein [Anaerolineales bacterium]
MLNEIKQDLQPRRLLTILTISLVIGAIYLLQVISLSVLVYSGGLAEYAQLGIGIGIFGGIITQLIVLLTSSTGGVTAGPQDSPAAILSIVAASISAGMIAASQEARFATVLMTVMLTTFFTGVLFLLVGWFNLSRFIRFIPYPVIGGFIAGTGLLIVIGGFSIMSDTTDLALLFQSSSLIRWVPGVLLAVTLLIASRRLQHFLVTPLLLALSIILFYVVAFASGSSINELQASGWLLGPFESGSLWKPFDLSLLTQVDWGVIASQATNLFAAGMISIVALLLSVSALELIAHKDIDPRRELTIMGTANLLSSFVGGGVSYHYLGLSALAFRMKANSRLVGVIVILALLAVLLFGAATLALLPKFMVGGLLLFLGLSFLVEWVYDAWFRLPTLDYILVLTILVVVGTVGFLQGVGVGILGAILLFAVSYSHIDVVNDVLSSANFRSNMERPIEHYKKLQQVGNQVYILRLQGFVFFGTAQNLLSRIRDRINDSKLEKLNYIILDFHRVSALDSSAVLSIVRIHQLTESNNIHLLFTETKDEIRKKLELSELSEDKAKLFHYFPTLDHGTEWCETRILNAEASSTLIQSASMQGQLANIFGKELAKRFMKYLVREEMLEWHTVFHQGDPPDSIFFVESGQLSAHFEIAQGKFIRLRSMGAGTVVGEVAVYLRQPRTASITATQPSVVYRLTVDTLKKIEQDDPEVAIRLHNWLATTLSQRLADNNRTLEALLN